MNLIAILVSFVSHYLIYEQEITVVSILVKVISVLCFDIFYLNFLVAYSYFIRIYHRVGGQLYTILDLLQNFDEGLII